MNASHRIAIAFVLLAVAGVPAVAQDAGPDNTCALPQCDNCTFPLPPSWKPPSDCWCYPPCPYAGTPDRGLPPGICFPYPQATPAGSAQTTETRSDGSLHTTVDTGHSLWPRCDPFQEETFPGNNFLPSIFTNVFDAKGREMVNTLPSTPDIPYNLHDGDPVVTVINPISPADDLKEIFDELIGVSETILGYRDRASHLGTVVRFVRGGEDAAQSLGKEAATLEGLGPEEKEQRIADCQAEIDFLAGEVEFLLSRINPRIEMGIDIFEGNPIQNRAYSGLAALHYDSANRVGVVEPIYDDEHKLVGGNVDVHQVWFGGRIESDTAFLDVSKIIPPCPKDAGGNCPDDGPGVPWTVTYKVDVLNRGDDDFSPFVTYWDGDFRSKSSKPHIGMDQSFFNMDAGTRTVFKIKMTPGKYLNLVYTWGWRMHPPRVQVMENANKRVNFDGVAGHNVGCQTEKYDGKTLVQMEQAVFGDDPRADKPAAIRMIGDLAPAKRMYDALLKAREEAGLQNFENIVEVIRDQALPAYYAWLDRLHLPCYDLEPSPDGLCRDGFNADPEADVTIVYANNTIYGDFTSGRPTTRGVWTRWEEWTRRPETLEVTIYNADNFVHAYTIADFGGSRGWENQFKSSVRLAGSGCWFTFGRVNWWMVAGAPKSGQFLCVPEAEAGTAGRHTMDVNLNFEPSRRLRFYQFDPWHHDQAIWSVH